MKNNEKALWNALNQSFGFFEPMEFKTYDLPLNERPFELSKDLTYFTKSGDEITVPAGYLTDFASVPRLFHRLINPFGRYGKASVVHDWLCDENPHSCSSKRAAEIFGEAMEALKVDPVTRVIMVAAVKVGGPRFEKGD